MELKMFKVENQINLKTTNNKSYESLGEGLFYYWWLDGLLGPGLLWDWDFLLAAGLFWGENGKQDRHLRPNFSSQCREPEKNASDVESEECMKMSVCGWKPPGLELLSQRHMVSAARRAQCQPGFIIKPAHTHTHTHTK